VLYAGDNTEIDKWSNVEKERPKKRIKLAAVSLAFLPYP
jgi:hypothetical protein